MIWSQSQSGSERHIPITGLGSAIVGKLFNHNHPVYAGVDQLLFVGCARLLTTQAEAIPQQERVAGRCEAAIGGIDVLGYIRGRESPADSEIRRIVGEMVA